MLEFFSAEYGSIKGLFREGKATASMGKFLTNKSDPSNPIIIKMNMVVFDRLKELLRDDRRKIKINACAALSDDDAKFDTES